MATAADLIKSSLRQIGAIASGETPSSAEQADALETLNDILEEWSNDGFTVFENKIENFTFSDGTGSYTIGSGATFDTVRPQLILAAKVKKAGSDNERPVKILSDQEWAAISNKSQEGDLPEALYYNRTYPNGTLYFWPVPSAADTLTLYSVKPFTTLLAATTLSYPPGYKKALKYTLACELGPEFGRPVNEKLEQIAKDAKASIQRTNTEPVLLISDAFGINECSNYDLETGE